jgi:hypothetical protein
VCRNADKTVVSFLYDGSVELAYLLSFRCKMGIEVDLEAVWVRREPFAHAQISGTINNAF